MLRKIQLSQQLDQERIARRQLEHKLAGTRFALVKLQTEVARQKAADATAKAEQHVG
jgi:hypothetical protein